MSLRDLLNKQKQQETEQKKQDSFKINFSGGKTVNPPDLTKTATERDGEDNSLASVFGSEPPSEKKALAPVGDETPSKTLPTAKDNSSPSSFSLEDINHESQPDSFDEGVVKKFRAALEMLKDHIDDKEIIGDAIKNVLGMLKEYDFLNQHLLPEDCGLMVRSLREGYNVVIQKKQTKQRKKSVKAQEVDKVLEELADFDVGEIG